jgi:rare lipoprotein A
MCLVGAWPVQAVELPGNTAAIARSSGNQSTTVDAAQAALQAALPDVAPMSPLSPTLPVPQAVAEALPDAPEPVVVQEQGGASWYGRYFHGRRTANGERYDQNELTAAHKTLPFGTVVRVRSEINGKEVDVRINDRGPFVAGRVIDLSQAAANALGMLQLGVKKVTLLLPPALRVGKKGNGNAMATDAGPTGSPSAGVAPSARAIAPTIR